MTGKKPRSKEYFAESEYGVKASPKVAFGKSNLKRGGGRDQTGKPYMVRGKMYYPKEDKRYKKVGLASWYGDAFHGRLTANGEIYDMTHLTAAHPTMPLPSYARVTNLADGSSVIVRVNDRGPYSHGRLIDLSHKAADMLHYANTGTAKVKVEYVGRAPLDGNDDQYLMASYKPGNAPMDPSDGLATGVMIAMNGPTPSEPAQQLAAAFPGTMTDAQEQAEPDNIPFATARVDMQGGDLDLPAFGPIAPERPALDPLLQAELALASLGYAPVAGEGAKSAFDALEGASLVARGETGDWKATVKGDRLAPAATPFIAAGSFEQRAEAEKLGQALSPFGLSVVDASTDDGVTLYSVNLYPDNAAEIDTLLQTAWTHGAPEAIVVRD